MALAGCGPSADDPCSPACGAGFTCYFGVCVVAEDASGEDGPPPDVDDDAGGDDAVVVTPGKVDLLFINNRFAHRTRGIFRNVLNSESPDDIRKLLGKEEYGDENVMGAVMAYDKQGFQVNYLGKDINIEFAAPR